MSGLAVSSTTITTLGGGGFEHANATSATAQIETVRARRRSAGLMRGAPCYAAVRAPVSARSPPAQEDEVVGQVGRGHALELALQRGPHARVRAPEAPLLVAADGDVLEEDPAHAGELREHALLLRVVGGPRRV